MPLYPGEQLNKTQLTRLDVKASAEIARNAKPISIDHSAARKAIKRITKQEAST